MYTFIRGINIHVCQRFVNLREIFAVYPVCPTDKTPLSWVTHLGAIHNQQYITFSVGMEIDE